MIRYLNLDYIKKTVIPTINKYYVRENNPAHDYLTEPEAMLQIEGCLERVKWDYVRGIIPKATQLFICINKGHYFENGNKRLALVTLLSFLLENGYGFRENLDKGEFAEQLEKLFPDFEDFEDEDDFVSTEFAYYNLTIIVADSGKYNYLHDELKEKVRRALEDGTISAFLGLKNEEGRISPFLVTQDNLDALELDNEVKALFLGGNAMRVFDLEVRPQDER